MISCYDYRISQMFQIYIKYTHLNDHTINKYEYNHYRIVIQVKVSRMWYLVTSDWICYDFLKFTWESMLKYTTLTWCNLGTVRDRHIKPYIFVNIMKRRIQNRVGGNLKIQISNGQKFKFLTVKFYFSTNTDLRPLIQFIKVPRS